MEASIATGIAVVALIVALWALRRIAQLEARIAQLSTHPEADGTASRPAEPPQTASGNTQTGTAWSGRAVRAGTPEQEPRPSLVDGRRLVAWLQSNWIYPVAGAALVMAAVFLVQYSIELGLLTPGMRMALALGLGLALIVLGEIIRRRFGDDTGHARYLPSTLSGAGIAALFAGVLAAFHLYEMLGQGTTMAALAAIALLALALGWVHGPLLAVIGVLAGLATPFLLGESEAPKDLLYGYFATLALLGLAVDGLRRWGWVSVVTVLGALSAVALIRAAGAGGIGLTAVLVLLPLAALALPRGSLVPCDSGAARPDYPTWAARLALALSAVILGLQGDIGLDALALAALALLHPLWTWRAPNLARLVLMPVVVLPLTLAVDFLTAGAEITYLLHFAGWMPYLTVALATLAGLAMLWRSEAETDAHRAVWALTGVGFPGATLVSYTLFWQMGLRGDAWPWAQAAMTLAAVATATALWAARRDSGQGLRLGGAVAASFALIAFAMTLLLSLSALSLALAALMIAAALMDRRFDIPLIGWFQALAAMAMGWRLLINPGLDWMLGDPATGGAMPLDVALSLGAALGGPVAVQILSAGLPRVPLRAWAAVVVDSALGGIVPVALIVAVARFLPSLDSVHATAGMLMTVLTAQAWVQLRRAAAGGVWLARVRRALAWLMGGAAGLLGLSLQSLMSPLFGSWLLASPVTGWPVINDLILGYAIPGGLLLWIGLRASGRRAIGLRGAGGLVLASWVALTIRHLWHGNTGMALRTGFEQGELYAYTVALLIAGASALALALRVHRDALRVLGLALIGLAAAKAFLVDASGLTGMLRVGAFLGLGLSLAGLAWLNSWVAARMVRSPGQ
ncbi:MAG: DUF2339 domain-containing protein [Rhodobacter sp.]|nr:DUF2339 domain-containing protein [Paracoccaceae bacterium]MCC0075294.1 DUF2339 domain-containing protein [Rhodobacter sp.]